MISYKLRCDNAHEFDGWFSSSADFDEQQKRQLIACPVCASIAVEKGLMAPAVSTSRAKAAQTEASAHLMEQEMGQAGEGANNPVQSNVPATPPFPTAQRANMATNSGNSGYQGNVPMIPKELIEKLREFKREIVANSEDVGKRFPEEARKMHYGEREPRGVYGTASPQEAAELADEGIGVLALPEFPDEKN